MPAPIAIPQKLPSVQPQPQPLRPPPPQSPSQRPQTPQPPPSPKPQPSTDYDSAPHDSMLDLFDLTPSISVDSGNSSDGDSSHPHNLEATFCRDFSCCGLVLRDLHDLLQHYEESHFRLEEENPAAMAYLDDWSNAHSGLDEPRPESPRDMMISRHDGDYVVALKRQQITAAAALSTGVNLSDVCNPNVGNNRTDSEKTQTLDTSSSSLLPNSSRKRTVTGMMEGDSSNSNDAMPSNKRPTTDSIQQFSQQQNFVDDELFFLAMLQLSSEDAFNEMLFLQQQLLLQYQPPQQCQSSSSTSPPAASPSTIQQPQPIAPAAKFPVSLQTMHPSLLASPSIPGMGALTNTATTTPTTTTSVVAKTKSNGNTPNNLSRAIPADRPYHCSVPGCEKSYKNANGLKYHTVHGQCTGAAAASARAGIPRSTNHGRDGSAPGLHDPDRMRPKPYRCTIPDCRKSYKNLNGLKYHVEHSHPGAVALPLGKKAYMKSAASVIAQARDRLQISDIKAVVVPAHLVPSLNSSGEPSTADTTVRDT